MTEAIRLWIRAKDSLQAAIDAVRGHPNSSASRSYYAAFEAVRALLTLDGKTFSKHTAVKAAIRRDLVHPGLWPMQLGQEYRRLMRLRNRGDYGGPDVSAQEAEEAVALATSIPGAVRKLRPDVFA